MNLYKKSQMKHKHNSTVTEDITPLLLLQDLKIQFDQAYYLEKFEICKEKEKLFILSNYSYLTGCLPSAEVTITNPTET